MQALWMLNMLVFPLADAAETTAPSAMRLEQFQRKSQQVQSGRNQAALKNTAIKGSWSGTARTPSLFHRGMTVESAQIKPSRVTTQAHRVRKVQWQYSFLSPVSADLRAYLCNATRCVPIVGASGSTNRFNGDSAYSHFMFAFKVNGRGALLPVMQGDNLQVSVNYE